MPLVKICGLSRAEDIAAVNEAGADLAGFVFYQKSKRSVSPDKARELRALLPPKIPSVGVFVLEDPHKIADLVNDRVIDIVQLHGSEGEDDIREIRELCGAKIIQAFVIRTADDLTRAAGSSADEILLDAGAGCGERFDWSILDGFSRRRFFLAGGLTPENVADAVAGLTPYAVDVSSGVETNGVKDKKKIREFVTNARKIRYMP